MKNKLLSLLFGAILLTLLAWALLTPDKAVSVLERRTLRAFPVPTVKSVLSGEWGTRLDAYLPDQFPAREAFRQSALRFRSSVLRLSDYKGVYAAEGSLVQTLYPLNEAAVLRLANRIDEVSAALFPGCARYCALIPDKGAYYAQASGHLAIDFQRMEALLMKNCGQARYVSIKELLSGADYYATDIHWRQERILPVAAHLADAMGAGIDGAEAYTVRSLYPFSGSYASRAARAEPETLTYLTSAVTDGAAVDNLQKPEVRTVYDPAAFTGMDGYDVFLSGASPLVTVQNAAPSQYAKGRTLVLFRDSFGSAIAPLLLSGYETVVLADLRYGSLSALAEHIRPADPARTDVLFLYGAETANTSGILR